MELLFSRWSFSDYKKIECKNCNVALKINSVSRLIIIALIPLLLLVQAYLLKLGINILVVYLLYLSFIIVLSPLIVRYKLIE